jgi:hypothetical protein
MSQKVDPNTPDWIRDALAFGRRRKPDPAEWARLSDEELRERVREERSRMARCDRSAWPVERVAPDWVVTALVVIVIILLFALMGHFGLMA